MRDDEKALLKKLMELHGGAHRSNLDVAPVDEVARTLGIHEKRAMHLAGKWDVKRWWEYGVSLRTGWFTEEGWTKLVELFGLREPIVYKVRPSPKPTSNLVTDATQRFYGDVKAKSEALGWKSVYIGELVFQTKPNGDVSFTAPICDGNARCACGHAQWVHRDFSGACRDYSSAGTIGDCDCSCQKFEPKP